MRRYYSDRGTSVVRTMRPNMVASSLLIPNFSLADQVMILSLKWCLSILTLCRIPLFAQSFLHLCLCRASMFAWRPMFACMIVYHSLYFFVQCLQGTYVCLKMFRVLTLDLFWLGTNVCLCLQWVSLFIGHLCLLKGPMFIPLFAGHLRLQTRTHSNQVCSCSPYSQDIW